VRKVSRNRNSNRSMLQPPWATRSAKRAFRSVSSSGMAGAISMVLNSGDLFEAKLVSPRPCTQGRGESEPPLSPEYRGEGRRLRSMHRRQFPVDGLGQAVDGPDRGIVVVGRAVGQPAEVAIGEGADQEVGQVL